MSTQTERQAELDQLKEKQKHDGASGEAHAAELATLNERHKREAEAERAHR